MLFAASSLHAAPLSPEQTARVDRLFAKWDQPDTPGVLVGIAQGGETVYARGFGLANLEHGVPMSLDTVSESGSVAKQFTAAAVALLAHRGKLSLDDPMRKHLPEMSQWGDTITVRMLLNHTSGIRDIHGLFELMGRPSYSSFHTNAEVLQVMVRQRQLNFEPGAEYLYSNGAYALAAVVVERVSGRAFGAFCRAEMFAPLGMTRTSWRDDFTAIVRGRAAGYEPRPTGGYRIDTPYSNLVGNGGLLTTIGDLLKWNAMLDAPKGEWVEVARMLQTRSKLRDGRTINYALGLVVDESGSVREVGHGGATSGYRTYLARWPERGLSVALLGNTADFNSAATSRAITQAVLGLPPTARPERVALTADELKRFAGRYHCASADAIMALTVSGGKLMEGGGEFVPTAPGKFARGRTTLTFDPAKPRAFTLTSTNGEHAFAAFEKARPTAAELAAYSGTYYSEELDVTHSVSVSGGRLQAGRWPGAMLPGEPTFADGFWFGRGWHATFTRDAAGKVTGMELTNASGRCRRIKFVRKAASDLRASL